MKERRPISHRWNIDEDLIPKGKPHNCVKGDVDAIDCFFGVSPLLPK